MGITIHYQYRLPVHRADRIPGLLLQIADEARALRFVSVEEPVHLVGPDCVPETARPDCLWAVVQARRYEPAWPDQPRSQWPAIAPEEIYVVRTCPGRGCEEANIGFRRFADRADWDWASFCKTQYAGNPENGGEANFQRSHKALLRLLRKMRTLGIGVEITDELADMRRALG